MKPSFPALAAARPHSRRRALLASAGTLAAALALPMVPAQAQAWRMEHWVGIWGAGQGAPPSCNHVLARFFPGAYYSYNKSKEYMGNF